MRERPQRFELGFGASAVDEMAQRTRHQLYQVKGVAQSAFDINVIRQRPTGQLSDTLRPEAWFERLDIWSHD